MPISLTITLVLIGSSVVSAFVALFLLSMVQGRTTHGRSLGTMAKSDSLDSDEIAFMFDDQVLVNASDAGRDFLAASTASTTPWGQLCALLAHDFPMLEAKLAPLSQARRIVLSGAGEVPMTLLAEWRAGLTRILLTTHGNDGQSVTMDRLSYKAMDQELANLRGALDRAPVLVWRESSDGTVSWANNAYLQATSANGGGADHQTWPLPVLFPPESLVPPKLARPENGAGPTTRAVLTIAGEKQPRWFDLFRVDDGPDALNFALPATDLVMAQNSLREFVQTLTKTFAHLPTGLVIFDRQRQLALFNPSLMDLTGLGVEFLSSRPTLFAFLDRLREDQRMPEPKNYKLWREQMVALERAASTGQYEEIWSLPNGQTYRITGRPHPDGAIALLFEDISAEISLSRRFQADIALRQATLDAADEAIVVFSPGGVLVLSNQAYARLWGTDPTRVMKETSSADALNCWMANGLSGPILNRLREFLGESGERAEWREQTVLLDGRVVTCRAAAIQGGSTMVRFGLQEPAKADALQKRRPPSRSARSRLIPDQPSETHENA